MNETEWVVQIPDKEVEDRYMGGWMAGWTDRDSSIVQLNCPCIRDLGKTNINADAKVDKML